MVPNSQNPVLTTGLCRCSMSILSLTLASSVWWTRRTSSRLTAIKMLTARIIQARISQHIWYQNTGHLDVVFGESVNELCSLVYKAHMKRNWNVFSKTELRPKGNPTEWRGCIQVFEQEDQVRMREGRTRPSFLLYNRRGAHYQVCKLKTLWFLMVHKRFVIGVPMSDLLFLGSFHVMSI